jgi:hypothetical protein
MHGKRCIMSLGVVHWLAFMHAHGHEFHRRAVNTGFFRGTTSDQDSRFGDAQKKLISKMSFAPVLSKKVRHPLRDHCIAPQPLTSCIIR